LKLVGNKNIIIVATMDKITQLECLRIDTGDMEIDNSLSGFATVITGYKEEVVTEIK
jgi:predicted polyphosphate/ATP-dependent NAD kinase